MEKKFRTCKACDGSGNDLYTSRECGCPMVCVICDGAGILEESECDDCGLIMGAGRDEERCTCLRI